MTDASGAVTEALPELGSKRRQIRPKAERRQQLIDATIRCIAQHGLSAVTMQMVTREAGLECGHRQFALQRARTICSRRLSVSLPRNITVGR